MSDEPATPGTPAQGKFYSERNRNNILIVESHMLSDLNSRFATIVTRNASIVDENKRLQEQVAQQSDNHAGKNPLNFTPLSFIARIHNRIYVTYF